MNITMTYEIAMAIARDAANARMRQAGRRQWNRGDYHEMCRVFEQLWPAETV